MTDGAPGPLQNFTLSASAIPLYGAAGLAVGPTGNLSVYNVNAVAGNQVIGGYAAWRRAAACGLVAVRLVGDIR